MVGDSLKRDMAGAAALGIRSVWRRNFSAEETEWETAIDSLSELTPLLR
jgi:FMN phosphatase YigB (HAD superfamily)